MNSTQLQQVALIDELANIAAELPRRDNIMAGKLLRVFDAYGKLTAAQEQVARSIVKRHVTDFCDFWA
jgi:hypothetical protein